MSQLKKYKRLKYLGKGSYGAAILVELRSNPSQRFVIKEIVIGHLKPAEQTAAKSEAEVLHQMNHSNITMYIESFVENSKLYIVMENADGGDLSTAIQNRKKSGKFWDEEEVMRIFVQICLALKHVHNGNILHRDLKSQNIFLTSKGVVKLGDFGIAKVLDATDDQARTQIGTPYYLSPEICESKPYGRESDVWSLGVLLYELIALEMPFQATSLPALVHRICVAEPNYSVVERRYSPGLISLTKTMLQKDPQKRPSVSQIVKSDFIKTHISRLLSYTLKAGNGGVEGNAIAVALPPSIRPSNVHNLNAEEVEKCIESVHSQLREQESKEVRNQSDREAARIQEREKLRKFRSDMAKVRRDPDTGADIRLIEEKESDSRYGIRPAPRVIPSRNMSPKNNRNVSPKSGGARPYSPKNNRPISPKAGRPLSPKARDAPSGRNLSPKNERNMSPINSRAAPSGSDRERALTPRSQAVAQAQREKDRKLAAAAAMRQESHYDYRDPRMQANQQQQQVMVSRNHGGGEYESAARREFFANRAAAQAVKAKIEAYDRNGGERMNLHMAGGGAGNGSAAAAGGAGAMVAGGGGVRSHPSSRRGSEVDNSYGYNQASDESSVYDQPSAYRGRGYSEEDSGNDAERRIAQIKLQRERDRERENALKEMQLKEALEANRDARRQAQNVKSAVAFEIDLGGAAQAPPKIRNSSSRQSLDDKSSSPYSLQSASPSVGAAVVGRNRNYRDEKDSTNVTVESDSGKGRTRKSWGPPVAANDIAKGVVRYTEHSTPTNHMFIPEKERENSNNNSKLTTGERYFVDDHVSNSAATEDTHTGAHHRNFSRDSIDSISINTATDEDNIVLRRLESKRNSQLEARQQAKEVFKKLREKRRKESELKGKRPSEVKVVEHEVVSPVKRVTAEGSSTGSTTTTSTTAGAAGVSRSVSNASPMQLRLMEVMNQVEIANESVQRAVISNVSAASGAGNSAHEGGPRRNDGTRSRSNSDLTSVMGSPANTPSRAGNTGTNSEANTPSRKINSVRSNMNTEEAKEVQALDNHIPLTTVEEDDLEYTLDNWLTQQKRGVTQRKKPVYIGAKAELDEIAAVEDGLEGYKTVSRNIESQAKEIHNEEIQEEGGMDFYISGSFDQKDDSHNTAGNDHDGRNIQKHHDIVRGKYMGNDVEVVGLQCMLAQALMGDGEEED